MEFVFIPRRTGLCFDQALKGCIKVIQLLIIDGIFHLDLLIFNLSIQLLRLLQRDLDVLVVVGLILRLHLGLLSCSCCLRLLLAPLFILALAPILRCIAAGFSVIVSTRFLLRLVLHLGLLGGLGLGPLILLLLGWLIDDRRWQIVSDIAAFVDFVGEPVDELIVLL